MLSCRTPSADQNWGQPNFGIGQILELSVISSHLSKCLLRRLEMERVNSCTCYSYSSSNCPLRNIHEILWGSFSWKISWQGDNCNFLWRANQRNRSPSNHYCCFEKGKSYHGHELEICSRKAHFWCFCYFWPLSRDKFHQHGCLLEKWHNWNRPVFKECNTWFTSLVKESSSSMWTEDVTATFVGRHFTLKPSITLA